MIQEPRRSASEARRRRAPWALTQVLAARLAGFDRLLGALADAKTRIGPPARCRERLDARRAAGATLPIVFPNPVGGSRVAAVARTIEAFAR